MKIGIITIHNSPNYGACLQAFALWKYLEMQGHDVEIIDLYRPYQKEYVQSKKYQLMRQDKSLTTKIKRIGKKILRRKNNLFSPVAQQKFKIFNDQIRYSKPYYGIDDLYDYPPVYDVYISGSDQLWNPTQPYCLEPYFLTFAPIDACKISYATSIGITELEAGEKVKFRHWLSSYFAISVREKQAKQLLESFTNLQISQVSDPTFLLDVSYWKSLAILPIQGESYILLFTLKYQPYIIDYCLKISKEANLPLVVLNQIQPESSDYIVVKDAGPQEFLGYIENAEMVITDSFHCTVFSLIMGAKNFYTIIGRGNMRGSRIVDLLEVFGLQKHLFPLEQEPCYKDLTSNSIDKAMVQEIIMSEQEKSRDFLSRAISIKCNI